MNKGQNLSNRQIIQSFIHLLTDRGGPVSSDSSLSEELLYYHILRFRARLLTQKLRERGYSLSKFNYQTISCIPLDEVDLSECPCAPLSGCTWRKTRYPIPSIIKLQSVTSITGNIKYDYLQWDNFEDLKNSRIDAEKRTPYYSFKNTGEGTHLYLHNDDHKSFIQLTAIFEDPNNAYNFPDCKTGKTDPCFSPLDSEFILDPDLLSLVYDLAYNSLFRAQNHNLDLFDDKNDNVSNTPSPLK